MDQECSRHHADVTGETRAPGRPGDGDGLGLAGLRLASASSASLSPDLQPTSAGKQGADSAAYRSRGDVAVSRGDAGAHGG